MNNYITVFACHILLFTQINIYFPAQELITERPQFFLDCWLALNVRIQLIFIIFPQSTAILPAYSQRM